MSTLVQSIQPRIERDLLITTSCPTGLDLRISVERFDGFFYDPSDGIFKNLGSVVDPYVPLVENPPASGTYEATLSVAAWTDGNYQTDLLDFTVNPASPTALDTNSLIYVDGGSGAPTGTALKKIDHNFGTADALRYVDGSNTPVENADVYAFTLLSYDAQAPSLQAIAKTETDTEGRWKEPFFLSTGQYVILFHKPNLWGPDIQNITVT